jgi:hypothetical protein
VARGERRPGHEDRAPAAAVHRSARAPLAAGPLTNLVARLLGRFRQRRVDVGTFQHPVDPPWPPVERQVDEGLLIASAAARLAVSNELIERSLRDGFDFDERRLRLSVRSQLLALARENEEDAERLGGVRDAVVERAAPDDDRDSPRLDRRIAVSSGLAARLRELSADPQAVDELAGRSREAALDELAVSVELSVRAVAAIPVDFEPDGGPDSKQIRLREVRDELARWKAP